MKLLKDLGFEYPSTTSVNKRHYGIYECPDCKMPTRASVYDVNIGDSTRCRDCSYLVIAAKKKAKASKSFKLKAAIVHSGKYHYDDSIYLKAHSKLEITCPTHGSFWQSPANHLSGKECAKCKGGVSYTNSEFHTKVFDLVGSEYIVKTMYNGGHKKVSILHADCGNSWDVIASSFLSGTRCPICAHYGFNIMKPAILYYFKIWDDRGNEAWKIGITNNTVEERYRKEACLDRIKIIKIWHFDTGSQALDFENNIKKLNKQHLYTGAQLFKITKNTELFNIDIYNIKESNDI